MCQREKSKATWEKHTPTKEMEISEEWTKGIIRIKEKVVKNEKRHQEKEREWYEIRRECENLGSTSKEHQCRIMKRNERYNKVQRIRTECISRHVKTLPIVKEHGTVEGYQNGTRQWALPWVAGFSNVCNHNPTHNWPQRDNYTNCNFISLVGEHLDGMGNMIEGWGRAWAETQKEC